MRRFVRFKLIETSGRVGEKILDDHVVKGSISQRLKERMEATEFSMLNDVDSQSCILKTVLIDTQEINVGPAIGGKRKPWMANKILKMISDDRE